MATKHLKDERIDLRVSRELKDCVAEAAAVYGMSVSAFIAMSAREQADRVLRQRRGVVLSNDARDRFLAALDRSPRAAPASIRRAAKEHRKRTSTG